MRHKIIAVDPGQRGAIVQIDRGLKVLKILYEKELRLPDTKKLNIDLLVNTFVWGESVAYLEYPTARPGEGANRALNFGIEIGSWETILTHLLSFKVRLVPPQTWTRRLGVIGKTKTGWEVNRTDKLQEYYGFSFDETMRMCYTKRGRFLDGICDALLLAYYGHLQEID